MVYRLNLLCVHAPLCVWLDCDRFSSSVFDLGPTSCITLCITLDEMIFDFDWLVKWLFPIF